MSIVIEETLEAIPAIITNEFFNNTINKTVLLIRELRENSQYRVANDILRLVTVCENLQLNLKEEQEKYQKLQEKHLDATDRIKAALKISQHDREAIAMFKKEINIAWGLADVSAIREQRAHESLNKVTSQHVKHGHDKFTTQTDDTQQSILGAHNLTIIQESERLTAEVQELNKRLFIQRAYSDELSMKLESADSKNKDLYQQWDDATNESLINNQKNEQLLRKVDSLEEKLENTTDDYQHFKRKFEKCNKDLKNKELLIATYVEKINIETTENQASSNTIQKLQKDTHALQDEAKERHFEIVQLRTRMALNEDDNKRLVADNEKRIKDYEAIMRKLATVEKNKSQLDQDILNQKNETKTAEKECDFLKKADETMKKSVSKLKKRMDLQKSELEKNSNTISDLKDQRILLDERIHTLELENKNCITKQKITMSNVNKLSNRVEELESEKAFLNDNIKGLYDEMKANVQLVERTKALAEEAAEQVSFYKHENNLSLKRCKDAEGDLQKNIEKVQETRDRWHQCKCQINDANEKISSKVTEIVGLIKKINRIEKRGREMKRDFEKNQMINKKNLEELQNIRIENKKYKNAVRDNEQRFVKLKSQMDKIVHDKDLIATQMICKADENNVLRCKNSLLNSVVDRGNEMYKERVDDISMMKHKIIKYRSECNILKSGLANTADMRHDIFQLHRQLNQERIKSNAIEQEMLTPMNTHRWRKLSYRNEKQMSLMIKYQRLQKKLLKQTAQMAKSDELIEMSNKKVALLEQSLVKHSTNVIQEKILLTRTRLTQSTKKMKAAIAVSRVSEPNLIQSSLVSRMQKEVSDLENKLKNERKTKDDLKSNVYEMLKFPKLSKS